MPDRASSTTPGREPEASGYTLSATCRGQHKSTPHSDPSSKINTALVVGACPRCDGILFPKIIGGKLSDDGKWVGATQVLVCKNKECQWVGKPGEETKRNFRCQLCGTGTVRFMAVRGGGMVPTCDACGQMAGSFDRGIEHKPMPKVISSRQWRKFGRRC